MKNDIRDTIAAKFVEALNAGTIPWRKPWTGGARPHNVVSRKPYRGGNLMYLALIQQLKGYATGQWLTFKGATQLGGKIKAGEKATAIMFWTFLKKVDKDTGKEKKVPFLRYYNVFNVDQTEGCTLPVVERKEFSPIAEAEKIFHGMPNRPKVSVIESDRAFYVPSADSVTLPNPSQFVNPESFYATAFHELAHSTGHKSRLNRDFGMTFGSEPYSKEELIAEMTAAFLSAECGILDAVEDNSKAYVQHWATFCGKEPRVIVDAAGAAQKAADYILNVTFDNQTKEESDDE